MVLLTGWYILCKRWSIAWRKGEEGTRHEPLQGVGVFTGLLTEWNFGYSLYNQMCY